MLLSRAGLKIAILAHEASKIVEQELIPAARARGHVCDCVDTGSVRLDILYNESSIAGLSEYDVVYYRTSFGDVGGYLILSHLRACNVPTTINSVYVQHPFITHKFYQTAVVAQTGVPVVATCTNHPEDFAHLHTHSGCRLLPRRM